MPKVKNIESVAKIKEKLDRASGVVVTDYQGLTHKQLEEIHKGLKKVNAEYLVVKNSLLKIAGFKETATGPTGVFLSYTEDFAPLKELFKFVKTFSLPKIKMGIINGTTYDDKQIAELAAIPSREILLSKLAYVLNANTQKLAYILSQIKKQEVN